MGRFSSPELVQAFVQHGEFPKIHKPMVDLIEERAQGRSFCDLGAHYGLLGAAVLARLPDARMIGVEADAKAIRHGEQAGIRFDMLCMALTRQTIPTFIAALQRDKVDVLLARRVLSEVWKDDLGGGPLLSTALAEAGVREVFIQGRQLVANHSNPLWKIEMECALFEREYRLAHISGELGYMLLA